MKDIKKKGETHSVCNKRLTKEGGKAKCCFCNHHSHCEFFEPKSDKRIKEIDKLSFMEDFEFPPLDKLRKLLLKSHPKKEVEEIIAGLKTLPEYNTPQSDKTKEESLSLRTKIFHICMKNTVFNEGNKTVYISKIVPEIEKIITKLLASNTKDDIQEGYNRGVLVTTKRWAKACEKAREEVVEEIEQEIKMLQQSFVKNGKEAYEGKAVNFTMGTDWLVNNWWVSLKKQLLKI